MQVAIAGNGILALSAAYRLVKRDPKLTVSVIGPSDHKGCATLAAAAMLNSFCELDAHTLSNKVEREKWLLNKSSTPLWPSFLKELEKDSAMRQEYGFGTFLINNHATDGLEDENFDAVVAGLKEFKEPYETVDPVEIKNYKPSPRSRAARAIYIKREGWVNPVILMASLKEALRKSGRASLVEGRVRSLRKAGRRIDAVLLENGGKVSADVYLLAPGAVFSKIVESSGLGIEFPRIFYGVGCSLLLETAELSLDRCLRTPNRGLACGVYAAPQGKGRTIVGASNLVSPIPEDHVRLSSVYTLLKSAMEQLNSDYYRAQLVKANVGWRPTSEDTLPLLGKTSIGNLLVATGTKRDGLHCAPLIAEAMGDLILTGKSRHDLRLYAPERKPIRFLTRREAVELGVRHTLNAAYQHGFESAKNRMVEDLQNHYREDLERLHDKVGARAWGIPPEMINMYRYGHARR